MDELAAVDKVSGAGESALWLAAKNGRVDAVKALVSAGANLNTADNKGDAPLSVAANKAIALILIEGGANLNAANKRGETALWLAAKNGHKDLVEALVQAGADVNKFDKNHDAPLSVASIASIATMLIERGANLNAANKRGQSALWLAAKNGREDVVELLERAGADVNKADNKSGAPLSVAAEAKIATMLIERGANVNATNTRGESALWLAAKNGRKDLAEGSCARAPT